MPRWRRNRRFRLSESVSAFWTFRCELPIGCGMVNTRNEPPPVTTWKSDDAWRIGVPDSPGCPLLVDVLRKATSGPCWTEERARSWALLSTSQVDANGIEAIGEAVVDATLDAHELTPFLARLAVESPAAVAGLFPEALPDCVLVLCGPDALPAALRGLQSQNSDHRCASASALALLEQSGVRVPAATIRAAIARESSPDVLAMLDDVGAPRARAKGKRR